MTLFSLPVVLSFISLVHGLPNVKRQDNSSIEWTDCEFPWDTPRPIKCAKLPVPLDYTDESSTEQLELDLVKVPATKEPVLGSIIINPGGPGVSGVESLVGGAREYLTYGGGQYNIIGFDPRGSGRTMPFNCSSAMGSSSLEERDGIVISPPLEDVLNEKWNSIVSFADACATVHAENGHLYGTAFVARDMVQIVDALGEDGLLRYHGSSYGTILGWTFAAMFPERVERMVLDGNINPHEYWAGYDVESTDDADGALQNLIDECVKSPEVCKLAEVGDAATILASFNEVLQEPPTVVMTEAGPLNFTLAEIKNNIYQSLYSVAAYPDIAAQMYLLIQRDFETLGAALAAAALAKLENKEVDPWERGEHGLSGTTCGDWPMRANDASELAGLLEMQTPVSSFVDTVAPDYWKCAVWPFKAAERYEGPFEDIETKFPVLFVNPTWDPITPLVSARNASASFVGSVVLEHRGNGHCAASQKSACTTAAVRDYYVSGTLPDEGTTCEPNVGIFGTQEDSEALQRPLYEEANSLLAEDEEDAKSGEEKDGNGSGNSTSGGISSSSSASRLSSPISRIGGLRELLLVGVVGVVVLAL